MQVQKREYKTYKLNELTEEAQQKAIECLYDINIDYDWWTFTLEDIAAQALDWYGIQFEPEHACFDLDRGSYFYIDAKHDGSRHVARIWFENGKPLYKALKARGVRQATINKLKREEVALSIDAIHYGGGSGTNSASVEDYNNTLQDADYSALETAANDILEDLEGKVMDRLRKEYYYLASEEAIRDTIEANDYDFLEDGSMFTL